MTEIQQLPQLGAYSLLRELGADSFGQLYLARHSMHSERLLVRCLDPEIVNGENFLVRFELLRPLLPTINQRNLVRVVDMGCADNVYYISYLLPPGADPLRSLADADLGSFGERSRTLEQLFYGIAQGLLTLLRVRDSYYKHGMAHDALSMHNILIGEEEDSSDKSIRICPKIWGFAEPFLFFGDAPTAALQYRLQAASSSLETEGLFREEWVQPPSSRRTSEGAAPGRPSFSFGQLVYKLWTGHSARGAYAKLMDADATIDSAWDKICDLCFAQDGSSEEERLAEVSEQLKKLIERRKNLNALERSLKRIEIPPSMALISFDDKVELGAEDGDRIEQPPFKARLKPFLIDKAPVTVAQFRQFLENYQPSSYSKSPEHPATLVSWQLAKAYCRWRSEREGLPPDTYRLPTEYEWEAAARGCLGHQYPWGPDPERGRAHCDQDKDFGAAPVKAHAPARFGIYDMLGNVWEWTESIFKPHPFSKFFDRRYDMDLRVVKGGCWFTSYKTCRASLRTGFPEEERSGHIGFRCVRPIKLDILEEFGE